MGKIPELLENVILTGYCTYRVLIAIHLITQNAKYASENDVYGWIENHNWPELEIASAIMAMIGLLSGQRFIFCFTVFFFILRTAINITVVTIDLYTVKLFFHYLQNSVVCFSGYLIPVMISCITSEHFSADVLYNCKWSDAFILIQDVLTLISLILMSVVVFLRLFCFIPERNDIGNDPIDENYIEQNEKIKLPFFISYKNQMENNEQNYKYNINYNDNPYKTSVI
uniref:Bm9344 n=1 Tax=Brugia malayi TaxID=6279 RepID=A0A0H5S4K8_BRUMA|nr:Bm9344 [Brugia malayi]